MSPPAASLTPTDIARIALKRLAELGLPPSPENYTKFYNAIAAIKSPTDRSEAELRSAYQVFFRVSEVLEGMAETSDVLMEDLMRGGEVMSQSLDTLRMGVDGDCLREVLGSLIQSTDTVHQTVTASHRDLRELRMVMDKIQHDLSINRKTLEQDALTGAMNRQGLDHLLSKEAKRAQRAGQPLTALVIDMDQFKQVNDKFGHLVGDKALTHFASIAKAVLRESDVLVRYAGEEFVILLPETELDGARYVIDRLRQVSTRTPLFHHGQHVELNFSVGVAALKEGENGHGMLLRAEEAVLTAAQQGPNAFHIAD